MNVVMYSKPGCQACAATKRHFVRDGIAFQEIDVTADPHAAQRLREMTSLQLPRVEVDANGWRDSWTGYRPSKHEELLEKYEIGA